MPFRAEKRRRFMFAKHPEIARRWMKEEIAVVKPKKKGSLLKKNQPKRK